MAHCIGKGTIRQTQMRRPTPGRRTMRRTSPINCARVTRRSFAAGAGAAGLLAATGTAFDVVRAQSGPLKVGVLLPRSGAQAGIGQDCQRGVELAPPIFKALGLPELAIMNADTETNVEVARARAETLNNAGAQLLAGVGGSGSRTAIAHAAAQSAVPG